jgi:hypothetical protein
MDKSFKDCKSKKRELSLLYNIKKMVKVGLDPFNDFPELTHVVKHNLHVYEEHDLSWVPLHMVNTQLIDTLHHTKDELYEYDEYTAIAQSYFSNEIEREIYFAVFHPRNIAKFKYLMDGFDWYREDNNYDNNTNCYLIIEQK